MPAAALDQSIKTVDFKNQESSRAMTTEYNTRSPKSGAISAEEQHDHYLHTQYMRTSYNRTFCMEGKKEIQMDRTFKTKLNESFKQQPQLCLSPQNSTMLKKQSKTPMFSTHRIPEVVDEDANIFKKTLMEDVYPFRSPQKV